MFLDRSGTSARIDTDFDHFSGTKRAVDIDGCPKQGENRFGGDPTTPHPPQAPRHHDWHTPKQERFAANASSARHYKLDVSRKKKEKTRRCLSRPSNHLCVSGYFLCTYRLFFFKCSPIYWLVSPLENCHHLHHHHHRPRHQPSAATDSRQHHQIDRRTNSIETKTTHDRRPAQPACTRPHQQTHRTDAAKTEPNRNEPKSRN